MIAPLMLAWALGIVCARMVFGVVSLVRGLVKLLFRVPMVGISVTLVTLFLAMPYTTAKKKSPDFRAYYSHRMESFLRR